MTVIHQCRGVEQDQMQSVRSLQQPGSELGPAYRENSETANERE
jgi:hypothetical protein